MMTTQKGSQNDRNQTSKNASDNSGKGKQGFASMPKEQVREIAAEGGRASHGGKKDDQNKR